MYCGDVLVRFFEKYMVLREVVPMNVFLDRKWRHRRKWVPWNLDVVVQCGGKQGHRASETYESWNDVVNFPQEYSKKISISSLVCLVGIRSCVELYKHKSSLRLDMEVETFFKNIT